LWVRHICIIDFDGKHFAIDAFSTAKKVRFNRIGFEVPY